MRVGFYLLGFPQVFINWREADDPAEEEEENQRPPDSAERVSPCARRAEWQARAALLTTSQRIEARRVGGSALRAEDFGHQRD